MKYIKNVHRHGSETLLIVIKNQNSKHASEIIKSSTTQKGIKSIISEYEGISWYNNMSRNKILCNLEKKTENYCRIKISLNEGFFNINSNVSYMDLKKYLDLSTDHYINIWQDYRNKEFSPFHGDLSLVGNIMFNNKDDVLFVDWEQFDNSFKMPTGIDLIMTLIENVWYESKRSNQISIDVFKHVKKVTQNLKDAKLLSPLISDKPAQNSLNFINSNMEIWNGQHLKLPVLKVPKRYILEIDNAIAN